jgi:hypothetical protein
LHGRERRRFTAGGYGVTLQDAKEHGLERAGPERSRRRFGVAPTPPVDDRIELLVPVPVMIGRQGIQGQRQVVRAGALLARRRPGTHGVAGFDLVGRLIPGRPHREARLPRGANTYIGEDELSLYAACDGEVMLRQLRIEVVPQFVHEGTVPAGDLSIRVDTPVFITGSVEPGACVEAEGDVYIQGSVREAEVVSRSGGITVMGNVAGAPGRHSVLRAAGEVACRSVRYGTIKTSGDLHLHAEAWQSTLTVGGNLYLEGRFEHLLLDVALEVEGGIFPRMEAETLSAAVNGERQHVRVATSLRAQLALHATPPLRFESCTLVELSGSGARCRLPNTAQDPLPGTIVQLKFSLPNSRNEIQGIARVARLLGPGLITVEFVQMSRRDQNLLSTYCLRLLLNRGGGDLSDRRLRRGPSHG